MKGEMKNANSIISQVNDILENLSLSYLSPLCTPPQTSFNNPASHNLFTMTSQESQLNAEAWP